MVERGFTLIEMGIVLVVIGLVVSGGLLAVSPVIQSAKISETKQKMATIEAALLGYVIQYGCLPCPAGRGATATGLPNNGGGTAPTGDYTVTTPCGGGTCTGAGNGLVPWIALGLSESDATDAWNRRLTYAVNPELTDAATDVQRNASGAFPTLASPNAIRIDDLAGANQGYTGLAYVLVSHGSDGAFGEARSGTLGADPHGTAADIGQNENGDGDTTFANGAPSNNGAAFFDDLVSFKAVNTLILSCGSGSCGNPS